MVTSYTVAQRAAISSVERRKHLQIVACAGSGKTQVVAARVVELLKSGVAPAGIVAFTFTRRAAAELKQRIYRLCREDAALGSDLGLAAMYVGTIHAYCLNLLQTPPLTDFLNYRLLDEVAQRVFIDRQIAEGHLLPLPLQAGGFAEGANNSRLYLDLLNIAGESKTDAHADILDYVDAYYRRCAANRYLDYTTVTAQAIGLLGQSAMLRAHVRANLSYLIVDEYQDVNPLQEMLIRSLYDLGVNLCVVGDDDQNIYQWRGSDVGNIIDFRRNYARVAPPVELAVNYRSSPAIVAAARYVAERASRRLPKQMQSAGNQPHVPGYVQARRFDSQQAEAEYIATAIAYLHGTAYRDRPDAAERGLAYGDFAVLVRARDDAKPIVAALQERGISVQVGGISGLFEQPLVKAMVAVFSYVAAADRQPAFDAERKLRVALRAAEVGFDAADIAAGVAMLAERRGWLVGERRPELHLQQIYLDLLRVLGVREDLLAPRLGDEVAVAAFASLGRFSGVISDFEGVNFTSPLPQQYAAFADFLTNKAARYYPDTVEENGATSDAVQIMTIHQAKGLQWPAVFVPGQHHRDYSWRRPDEPTIWDVLPAEAVEGAERYMNSDPDDERRVFYVATTRAERYLFVSWARRNNYSRSSAYFSDFVASGQPVTGGVPIKLNKAAIRPRTQAASLKLTFSQLKYYFDCAYQYKLHSVYGFDAPLVPELGYGKSLHDMLAELHSLAITGKLGERRDVDVKRLVDRHLHLPYALGEAGERSRQNMKVAAIAAINRYLDEHWHELPHVLHTELPVELLLAGGITVSGRVDLIRRGADGQPVIVDFKSKKRAQSEELTGKQLLIYVAGFERLSGERAQQTEIHNLDDGGVLALPVAETELQAVLAEVKAAGEYIRVGDLPRLPDWGATCAACTLADICRMRPVTLTPDPSPAAGRREM